MPQGFDVAAAIKPLMLIVSNSHTAIIKVKTCVRTKWCAKQAPKLTGVLNQQVTMVITIVEIKSNKLS